MSKLLTDQAPKRMDEITHLLREIARIQRQIAPLPEGADRQKLAREWREISDTLTSKLKAAKYFRYDEGLYLKFINVQVVEVVYASCLVCFETFNAGSMDTLLDCCIVSEREYLEAVGTVVEKGGQAL